MDRRLDRYLPALPQFERPSDPEWWQREADPGDAEAFLAAYDELDELLVSKGFPPTSEWWRERIERFLRSGRKTSVWRVGRRGGKSSTFSRVLVVLGLFAKWPITPGDTGIVTVVSVDLKEATARSVTIRTILRAVGIGFAESGNATRLLDRPIEFVVKTCSISGTSGFTSVVILADEMAKWRSPSDGANPSKEILTSLRATTATQPDAKIFASSSALSTTDHHAKMIDAGDSAEDDQVVFIGATWETNPTVTEDDTRKLEPDRRKHDREYGSIPTDAGETPWFVDDEGDDSVEASLFSLTTPNYPDKTSVGTGASYGCIDTGFRRNASGLVILRWENHKLITAEVLKIVPEKGRPLKPSEVFSAFADRLRAHDVKSVAADQHYIESAKEHLSEFDVVELPGGPSGKADVYTRARDTMRERNARIPKSEKDLVRQLRQVGFKLSSGGTISIKSPVIDGQHGDLASAYVGAVWLAIEYGPNTGSIAEDLAAAEASLETFNNSRYQGLG